MPPASHHRRFVGSLRARPGRRRQRSVRLVVATGLLAAATVVVLAATATQSSRWLTVAAIVALLCGAAASRIVHSELVQSRREAAADRAAQARSYRDLDARRAREHAAVVAAMTARLLAKDGEIRELAAALAATQRRVADAELRVKREARRANEAQEEVARLHQVLEIRRAEEADELAMWQGHEARDDDTVVDLVAWEDRGGARAVAERRRA